MPRYVILGAGAVGGALGGRLGLAGRDVVLAARGDHLAALREHGYGSVPPKRT
jgi:2-dehydropantoate 2-reductase